ncbi:ChaC-domain-containing protein [Aaosphaeria arxii CBS 175.79]|uniref:glutathione-specific gamma-glutamylcyclotransferase n=1 Tax=Aaosphaeria arxii CBS 175.79 TaxID=1450172 RepID=A0A6A5XKE7_9PLEO|nr:ChaC-domain-containing protein [Aaosphaeria arxii CBS 175.79]KAF2013346.1 ChaC-domain-containing protein [Aaosphaeria arxii CBS 175.79]
MAESEHQRQIEEFGKDDDFWLFGYGSLIWKPPPHFDQRIPGYIEGYVRRFWQASEDHRGTPSAPGRVVTLIDRAHWETLADHDSHTPTERVWGAAYHIPARHVAEVREYLDIREINGYSIQFTPFHPAPFTTQITSPPATSHGASPVTCLVYIGLPENPQFLGPQDTDELAAHILRSRGPSGENREYLFNLEKSLLELSAESGDRHISDLVRRARAIERERGDGSGGEDGDDHRGDRRVGVPLHKVGSTEEQEEVER